MPVRNTVSDSAHLPATARDVAHQKHTKQHDARPEPATHPAQIGSIGEIVTHLTHEASQPLTAIVNYTNGCLRRARADEIPREELQTALEQILIQAQRAADALAQLQQAVEHGEIAADNILPETSDHG